MHLTDNSLKFKAPTSYSPVTYKLLKVKHLIIPKGDNWSTLKVMNVEGVADSLNTLALSSEEKHPGKYTESLK